MSTCLVFQQPRGRSAVVIRNIPDKKYGMYFQGHELLHKHFVVGVTGNKNYEIELSYCCKFVSFEGKPYIYTFLNHSDITAFLYFPKMLVMDNFLLRCK